jgi:hypothetical protein
MSDEDNRRKSNQETTLVEKKEATHNSRGYEDSKIT